MSIIRSGTFTVASGSAAQQVVIGSQMSRPTRLTVYNQTNCITPADSKITEVRWFPWLIDGSAIIQKWGTQPALTQTYTATNGITPYVTADSLLWVPNQVPYTTNLSTNLVVTDISNAANAEITASNSFTSADVGVTWVTFKVMAPTSMIQINTLRGQVASVIDNGHFTVNINTTGFSPFDTGFDEQANVITGAPVSTQFGPQIINTPQMNLGTAGFIMGTTVIGSTDDVWNWIAEFDTSVNG